jgi:hypothetical protein
MKPTLLSLILRHVPFAKIFIPAFLVLYSFNSSVVAQAFYIPSSGSNSITTCSGTLYDWAGTGSYGNG